MRRNYRDRPRSMQLILHSIFKIRIDGVGAGNGGIRELWGGTWEQTERSPDFLSVSEIDIRHVFPRISDPKRHARTSHSSRTVH